MSPTRDLALSAAHKPRRARILATVIALVAVSNGAWAINRCEGPDGKVIFQDAPCAGAGSPVVVRPASGYPDGQTIRGTWLQQAKTRHVNEITHGIASGEPVIGMSTNELELALGRPSSVDTRNAGGRVQGWWTFNKPYGIWSVYVDGGTVTRTRLQRRSTVTPAAPIRCPTDLDLRNLRVSALKLGATELERWEYRRALERARQCGM